MAEHQLEAQVAADVQTFRANGYVKLPSDLLAPEDLAELRRVYRHQQAIWRSIREEEQEKAMADPEQSWRSPGYFDIPWTVDTDDAFLKLACNQRLIKIVENVIGEDVFLQDLRARTVIGLAALREGDGTFDGEGSARAYTGGFHHDGGQIGFADHETLSQSVKLFFAISAQDIETGCTSVIPGTALAPWAPRINCLTRSRSVGTHRIGEGGWGESPGDSPRASAFGLVKRGQDAAHGGGRSAVELDDIKGQDPLETEAGGSLLMDLRCWHTALPCRTDRDREGFILQYSPFKQRQEVLTREAGRRMDTAGKLTTPIMRQVMGIELQPSLSEPVPEPPGATIRAPWDPMTINTPNLASPSYPAPPPASLQPPISSFRIDGCVRIPQLVSGTQLENAQGAFIEATANMAKHTVSLVGHVGEFLSILALPKLIELAGELMPSRYEGTPQCVSLTGHTAPTPGGGWRRDYSRPARDIVLLGPPAPPQHMADELKVYIALQDGVMPLFTFGIGSHRMAGVPEDESPSIWEARAGDAIIVDGRTRYNDDVLGQGAQVLVAKFASKKEKNEEVRIAAMQLDSSVVEAAGEHAPAVLGVAQRSEGFGEGGDTAPNSGGLPPSALQRVWQPGAKL
jgi:hypothetical protein